MTVRRQAAEEAPAGARAKRVAPLAHLANPIHHKLGDQTAEPSADTELSGRTQSIARPLCVSHSIKIFSCPNIPQRIVREYCDGMHNHDIGTRDLVPGALPPKAEGRRKRRLCMRASPLLVGLAACASAATAWADGSYFATCTGYEEQTQSSYGWDYSSGSPTMTSTTTTIQVPRTSSAWGSTPDEARQRASASLGNMRDITC